MLTGLDLGLGLGLGLGVGLAQAALSGRRGDGSAGGRPGGRRGGRQGLELELEVGGLGAVCNADVTWGRTALSLHGERGVRERDSHREGGEGG